jgi:hypothetical protein
MVIVIAIHPIEKTRERLDPGHEPFPHLTVVTRPQRSRQEKMDAIPARGASERAFIRF